MFVCLFVLLVCLFVSLCAFTLYSLDCTLQQRCACVLLSFTSIIDRVNFEVGATFKRRNSDCYFQVPTYVGVQKSDGER